MKTKYKKWVCSNRELVHQLLGKKKRKTWTHKTRGLSQGSREAPGKEEICDGVLRLDSVRITPSHEGSPRAF